jgi:hypothetical protein
VKQVTARGPYRIGGEHYKKVPRGYDPEHRYAEYLLHNALWASFEANIPPEFYRPTLLDYCFSRFKDMIPIHRWLTRLMP